MARQLLIINGSLMRGPAMSNGCNKSLRLKRFEAASKERKVASLETIIRDLDSMAAELSQQIAAEEQRTKVSDARRANYSMVAISAAARRRKLMVSLADLRAALEAANRGYAAAAAEVRDLEMTLGVPSENANLAHHRPQSLD